METKEQLQQELRGVENWEREQEDLWFWERWGKLPFQLLDKLTPKFLHDKINAVLDELSQYIHSGSKYVVSKQAALKRFEARTLGEVGALPLRRMDKAADSVIASRKTIATAQGATTGFGGLLTLGIDIPALLGMSLHVLQEMALCYGYDPEEEQERLFIVKCLQFSSSDIVGKQTILRELQQFDSRTGQQNGISQVAAWREVITVYRDNYGWKKLFQLVPVAGMVFGAYLNRKTIEEIAEAGKMLYRKRRVLERLQAASLEQ
ncbi:EcsC family protein [Ectobacillus ponti]|uniref:EcsC family protein n=1 Tax=Ectobacillus ponti TaxID=2961894 RepID=A0AA41X3S5_9BACI|nr:EcsC family protein [Ectobacillus ponti]MCP8968414.1 EcsC family protein [Ectobacillus ponti]